MAEKYNTVPEPSVDPEGLLKTTKALKAVVDQLTGVKGNIGAARTYVQQAEPVAVLPGDVWVKLSDQQFNPNNSNNTLTFSSDGTITSIWSGAAWVTVAVAGCFYEQFQNGDVTCGPASYCTLMTTQEFGGVGQIWNIEYRGNYYVDGGNSHFSIGIRDNQSGNWICAMEASAGASFVTTATPKRTYKMLRPTAFLIQGYSSTGTSGSHFPSNFLGGFVGVTRGSSFQAVRIG